VRRVGEVTGLHLDASALAGDLPVGLQQRLEIVKVLSRDVRVLILDEPTAALTPGEVADLFAALRRLAASGAAIVLITHKMREVLAIADRVTVLRRGAVALTGPAAAQTPERLADAMIGEAGAAELMAEALEQEQSARARVSQAGRSVLSVRDLVVAGRGAVDAVRGVSFEVAESELVGIAAVEGNGQRELLRAVSGLVPRSGSVVVGGSGQVSFVPENRQGEGLILDFTLAENLALGNLRGVRLRLRQQEQRAAAVMAAADIRAEGPTQPVRALSGGNQQKVVIARALAQRPALLVAENPTRGLDLRATADVHQRLRRAARDEGLGVLFYSSDLDEVLALADRIAVMSDGRWHWVGPSERARERVGALMLGAA